MDSKDLEVVRRVQNYLHGIKFKRDTGKIAEWILDELEDIEERMGMKFTPRNAL